MHSWFHPHLSLPITVYLTQLWEHQASFWAVTTAMPNSKPSPSSAGGNNCNPGNSVSKCLWGAELGIEGWMEWMLVLEDPHVLPLRFGCSPAVASELSLCCCQFAVKLMTWITVKWEMNLKLRRSILLLCVRVSLTRWWEMITSLPRGFTAAKPPALISSEQDGTLPNSSLVQLS